MIWLTFCLSLSDEALDGAKGKARPYGGRDHGLSAGRDGAAHGRARLG